jgi:hypothetical protein
MLTAFMLVGPPPHWLFYSRRRRSARRGTFADGETSHAQPGRRAGAATRARQEWDLDGALPFGHLPAQLANLGKLVGGRSSLQAPVGLGLADPGANGLGRAEAEVPCDIWDLAAPFDHLVDRPALELI